MKRLKIWLLKRKARKQHLRYHNLLASLSCGTTVAEYICSEVIDTRLALQDTLMELEGLGERLHE